MKVARVLGQHHLVDGSSSLGKSASRIDALVERGVRLHREGRIHDAVAVWKYVLEIAPDEPRARTLLAWAKATHPSGTHLVPFAADDGPGSSRGAPLDRPALERALRDRRYLDALAQLEEARVHAPEDATLTRGIDAIRAHLEARLLRRVGSANTRLTVLLDPPRVSPAARDILAAMAAMDDHATVEAILARSAAPRHEACVTLLTLIDAGVIGVSGEPEAPAGFEAVFSQATEAYLEGDYPTSYRLYRACLELRPDDPTALHNLARLEARMARG